MRIFCSRQCEFLTCQACRELQALQGEVEAAEVALRNAKRRRAAHIENMNGRRAAVTKLPTEIVRYIIELYIAFPEHEMKPSEYATYPAIDRPRSFRAVHRRTPLLLGAICRQWRAIAWSFPDLWSTIIIPLSCPWHEHGPQMVSEWLQRSGELPLSIQINDKNSPTAAQPRINLARERINDNAKAIIRILNQYASRWEVLDFSETYVSVLEHIDAYDAEGPSMLRHLCLGGITESYEAFDTPQTPLLIRARQRHAPTHLNLLSFIAPQDLAIDWSALTHLYLEGMSRDLLFDLLNHTEVHLTHLTIQDINGYDLGDVQWHPGTALTMPNLVSLSINEHGTEYTNTRILFQFLNVPSLRSFKYDGADSDYEFSCSDFLNFIGRSQCQLDHLDLQNHCLLDADLETLLRALPTLTSLKVRLELDHDSVAFLQCLSAARMHTDATPFLPALRRLDVAAYMRGVDWGTFLGIYGKPFRVGEDGCPVDEPMPVPARKDLKVRFNARYLTAYGHHGLMDRNCLMSHAVVQQLVWLWRKFRVTCMFEFEPDDPSKATSKKDCFLVQSFNTGSGWGVDPSRRSKAEANFLAMWDDIVTMTNLQF